MSRFDNQRPTSPVNVPKTGREPSDKIRAGSGAPSIIPPAVPGIAALVSMLSFFYFFQHRDLLLYGDAVAHINIARRVFDSQTPGLLQLGTVWLPLPHLLMIPFIVAKSLWQNGAGGSMPSMAAYILGVIGIFRLMYGVLDADGRTKPAATVGAAAAAFVYGANPNLIYLQATAMTESIYLAFFIWAAVFFAEYLRSVANNKPLGAMPAKTISADRQPPVQTSLLRCACCLAGAELTRYDGWILAAAIGVAVAVVALYHWQDRAVRGVAIQFLFAISVVPILWFAYNLAIYGNALAFANGPYSAKAIEERVGAPNPALHNATVAALYFLKSAQLNMAEGDWGRFWLAGAIIAFVIAVWKLRPHAPQLFLLLGIPLPFYALSIAYGSVPLHVHTWWPFATFNQRYGLQLLPLFAVSAGVLAAFVFVLGKSRHSGKLVALIFALLIGSYAVVWKAEPQCLQEAHRNWDIRNPLNAGVRRIVSALPANSRYLMDLSEHVGIMEEAGIPLRQVINSENRRQWKRPSDPDGLWERALADPSGYVDFVIAFEGDLVDQSVNRTNLVELTELHVMGQPHARIYATRAALNQSR